MISSEFSSISNKNNFKTKIRSKAFDSDIHDDLLTLTILLYYNICIHFHSSILLKILIKYKTNNGHPSEETRLSSKNV